MKNSFEVKNSPCQQAAELLDGRSVAMFIGGNRPHAKRALENAFRLKELVWVNTSKKPSYQTFEAPISRPDIAVVLFPNRWAGHGYKKMARFCTKYNKPMVRLPGGVNPNQVAAQIVAQCSQRLQIKNRKTTQI